MGCFKDDPYDSSPPFPKKLAVLKKSRLSSNEIKTVLDWCAKLAKQQG